MAYKDKALQRKTTRLRVRRYRDGQKALHDEGVKPKLEAMGLKVEGNGILGVKPSLTTERDVELSIPIYDPTIHRPGDRVRVKPPYGKKLIEITIPRIDGEGNLIPDFD